MHLTLNGNVIAPKFSWQKFTRFRTNDGVLKGIVNHFRVFHIPTFKNLHPVQYRDMYGKYFPDRIHFL